MARTRVNEHQYRDSAYVAARINGQPWLFADWSGVLREVLHYSAQHPEDTYTVHRAVTRRGKAALIEKLPVFTFRGGKSV